MKTDKKATKKASTKKIVNKSVAKTPPKKSAKKASTKKAVLTKVATKKSTKSAEKNTLVKSSPKKGIDNATTTKKSTTMTKADSKSVSISGNTFLFTGTLTGMQRKEAEALVKDKGGSILSGVSDKLNYLVVGEDAGGKLEKAKALGNVKILTENEFLKMAGMADTKSSGNSQSKKSAVKVIVKSAKSSKKGALGSDTFKEVKIGNQIWMAMNLNVTHFRNGDAIPEAKTDEDWKMAGLNNQPAWCYYENKPSNASKYGKLYNWHAVNDKRGLAPIGWHIPTEAEWASLTNYLGADSCGKKMKSSIGWPKNMNGTNESGFSGFPGGYRYGGGMFSSFGKYGYWWSSTEDSKDEACLHGLSYYSDSKNSWNMNKRQGFSVRCIRD